MDGVPDRQKLCAGKLSHFRVFATPWTVAHQAPLSMGFSRQEYWSRLAHPTPGDLPNPRIKLASPESPALAGGFFTTVQPGQVKVKLIQSCLTLCDPIPSPGQNIGGGSLSLLQGIFPTQGSKPVLPHCRWILYQLSHQGSPGILEWVAYPLSSESS